MSSEQDVIAIIAKQAKKDPTDVTRTTTLADLDLQSIDVVEVVFAIEEKFDIEVPYSPSDQDKAGISFQSVGEIADAVDKLLAEQHPA